MKLLWLRRRDNKINTIQYDRYIIYKTLRPSHTNQAEYKKSNVSSHLHIFSLNFDKSNHE